MNIWNAYTNTGIRNQYRNVLIADGYTREEAQDVIDKMRVYIDRINETIYRRKLEKCNDIESFRSILDELFHDKWKEHIHDRYKHIPQHFFDYISYLDSVQAIYDDYINEEERVRLVESDSEIPICELTKYETSHMKDGKLTILMNPLLLKLLKSSLEGGVVQVQRAGSLCRTFYGELLPEMKLSDFSKLVSDLWNGSKKPKKGGRKTRFQIEYPDGSDKVFKVLDGVIEIVNYYGMDDVIKQKVTLRGMPLVAKTPPYGKEESYLDSECGYYIIKIGNTKDYLSVARRIIAHYNHKLKIEMI